jgi:hypothetical protein
MNHFALVHLLAAEKRRDQNKVGELREAQILKALKRAEKQQFGRVQ